MKKTSTGRRGGSGKSVLSFFIGMIMGIVLFVGAIFGTIYAIIATVSIGDIMDKSGVDSDEVFDEGSDMPENSILDLAMKLYGDIPNIGNMTLNELTAKYGVSNKLQNTDIAGIDFSSIFDLPISEIPDGFYDVIMGITLGNIGNIANIDFAGYNIPILTDNLNIPIRDAVNILLETLSGDLTLRQIEDNFGITLGEGGIFDSIKDTPLSELSIVIEGLRIVDVIGTDNDKFVKIGENTVYVKTGRYEAVSKAEIDHINHDAMSYICGIEDGVLLERELRFVQKTSIDEDGNEYVVTDEDGNIVYVVDNSCYDNPDSDKTYYRYFEYEPYDSATMPATGEFFVKVYGNRFVESSLGYALAEEGFTPLKDLFTNEEGNIFTTDGNTVNLEYDIFFTDGEGNVVKADKYGIDPFVYTIDSSTYLVSGNEGYARVHIGTADTAVQLISYLTIGSLENATGELENIKLGDVIEINEDSAYILQVMKDTCLKDFSMSIDDLLLSEVIEIDYSLYTEDPNGAYIFVTLPTDKYVEYDESLHAGKDKYVLTYVADESGKYVLKDGNYYYYDDDDTSLQGLPRYSRRFYLADGSEPADTIYYAHDKGGYYTLYHPKYGTDVTRYTKQTTPSRFGEFKDYILVTDEGIISSSAFTKFYWNGSEMVEGVMEGQPVYIPGKASSKALQRLASTTIGDLSEAFDNLILGDVIDIDPDIYEYTYDTSDESKQYFYEIDGVFFEASQEFIASNPDNNYFVISSKGTSHIVMKKMAYLPVLQIGNRMEEVINELYLEDLIDIIEHNIIEANLSGYGEAGDYFTPYDDDYTEFVGDNIYKYAYIPNADGKYYLRDYEFFALTDEQASAFLIQNDTLDYHYLQLDLSTLSIVGIATYLNEFAMGNGYIKDANGVYHNNPALCAYITTKYRTVGATEGIDSIYVRESGSDGELALFNNPTYNGEAMLYVKVLGQYVVYDQSNYAHADLQKYLLLRDGYALVSDNAKDTRTHYYYNATTGTFSTDSTGAVQLTFVKNSVKGNDGTNDLYYYVALDGKFSEDKNNGILHTTYSKNLAETTYMGTDESTATHVFVDGKIYAIDQMPTSAENVVFVKEMTGVIFTIEDSADVASVLSLMSNDTINIAYIQKQSVAALRAFAKYDVKVGGLNTAIDQFTVNDMITIAPDSMLDDEDIKHAKINDLSKVFQTKLKNITIKDILNWSNITTLDQDVLSIIGEATLEDFFASLSYSNGDIHIDLVKLFANIYARQNQ